MNTEIRLVFTEERVRDLDRLMADMGISERKILFNIALSLLDWANEQKKRGRVIASVDKANQSYEELVLPGLK